MPRDEERKRARHREYMLDRYRNDPEFKRSHLAKVKVTKQRHLVAVREVLSRAKLIGCACGETDHAVLDFHHRDPRVKSGEVANWGRLGWSLTRLQCEIAKCDVVCANCHRRLHSRGAKATGSTPAIRI